MNFSIEQAVLEDYKIIAEIIQEVWEQLAHKEWFAADNADYTYRMLHSGKGKGYKAIEMETGNLAGVFMVTFPGMEEENLGRDIEMPEAELKSVVHMETVAILPEYRGHHLQHLLMQNAEMEMKQAGYKHLLCTVHPDNVYSKENIIKQGYEVVKTKEKYGGYQRDILLKDI